MLVSKCKKMPCEGHAAILTSPSDLQKNHVHANSSAQNNHTSPCILWVSSQACHSRHADQEGNLAHLWLFVKKQLPMHECLYTARHEI